jgi:hypothetical protein
MGIHQIPGLTESEMRGFMSRVRSAKRTRATRSILRECRLWFKRHCKVEVVKVHSSLISFQDGMA